ncbi:MAG: non-ribosomal peptide synthetase [Planctomycetota bacterium]|jgi:amino acid adenylation domain-containing protein
MPESHYLSEHERVRANLKAVGPFAPFAESVVEGSIGARFERTAREYADRRAVKTAAHDWTYRELAARSRAVACALAETLGGPQERVGIMLETDAPMIAAFLGTLLARTVYVPLDPALPQERSALILKDAEVSLVLTDAAHESSARAAAGKVPVVAIESLKAASQAQLPEASADDLAWLLYTSGSTGRPKGVMQTHRTELQIARAYTNDFLVTAADRLTLLFSCAVNAGCQNVLTALLNGASVHQYSARSEGIAGAARLLLDSGVTLVWAVPTMLRHLAASLSDEVFDSVRLAMLTGEPLYRRDLPLYRKHFPRTCILANRVGSTETGTIRRLFLDHDTVVDVERVPVGFAGDGYEVLLLDDAREREVPEGEVGEIAARSRYLTPGYWRRDDLTAEAFPAHLQGDERVYCTGDMGRMRADGCLEHLGRKDYQVKIRGFRVETAEVEAVLLEFGGIRETVAVARDDSAGEKRLIAYVVPDGPAPTASALRRFLAARLPEHMVPSVFTMLEALPRAPNGKVHLSALPPPGRGRPVLDVPFTAPRTPLEKAVAEIWTEVLDLDEVGVDDDFGDLGGHSLKAAQVTARIRSRLGIEMPMASLVRAGTVAQMALEIVKIMVEQGRGQEIIDEVERGEAPG